MIWSTMDVQLTGLGTVNKSTLCYQNSNHPIVLVLQVQPCKLNCKSFQLLHSNQTACTWHTLDPSDITGFACTLSIINTNYYYELTLWNRSLYFILLYIR